MILKALILCELVALGYCAPSLVVNLENYNSATPTRIAVQDGSKLYLASSDDPNVLAKITVSSNGQTKLLSQLLNDNDANGFLNGFPVNSDLTIATTNTVQVTDGLNGYLFISSPDMVKDTTFLVYLVGGQVTTIDRSNAINTTMVILNTRVEKAATDPATKPFYSTRIEKISQSPNSNFYMHLGIPFDGYTEPNYQKLIFMNPVYLYPTGNPTRDTVFFKNIEPIQYTLRLFYIRVVGGGFIMDVSRNWMDSKTYTTTNETTTGYTMAQRSTYASDVMYKNTPGHDAVSGYMINTADMLADLNVTSCNGINCESHSFLQSQPVVSDVFQYSRNDTQLKIDIQPIAESGIYYLQYFRIEGGASAPGTTGAPVTSTKLPETTTKSSGHSSIVMALMMTILCIL